MGCSRYPECDYIKKDGPPPPAQLPFEVACPTCHKGHLTTRRARRTGSLFWGCSRYPTCRYTTSHEPIGAVHDADDGPIARAGEQAMCLVCGAPVELVAEADPVGARLVGGEPNAAALAKPSSGRQNRRPRATKATKSGSRATTSRTARTAASGARREG
jgi:ssDNA-binding Zn-finger/Zn-ribbon topoisomerase 1